MRFEDSVEVVEVFVEVTRVTTHLAKAFPGVVVKSEGALLT